MTPDHTPLPTILIRILLYGIGALLAVLALAWLLGPFRFIQ
jgi:hypothetical protein